jgi:hypothetical protein
VRAPNNSGLFMIAAGREHTTIANRDGRRVGPHRIERRNTPNCEE